MAQIKDALFVPPHLMGIFRDAIAALQNDQELTQQTAYNIFEHAPNGDPIADFEEGLAAIEYCCGQAFLDLFRSGSDISPEALIKQTKQSLTRFFDN